MAEKLLISHEQHEALALPTPEQSERLHIGEAEQLKALAEQQHDAEKARSIIAAQEHTPAAEMFTAPAQPVQPAPTFIDRALKLHTLRRELQNIQRRESPAARTFSKVIHQPAVRAVSETAGKTVSRPSGLLGGGVLAFIGTSLYLYAARYYGFEYNYFVFLVLFAAGFGAGLLLEAFMRLIPSKAR